jgi:hypothetical protein
MSKQFTPQQLPVNQTAQSTTHPETPQPKRKVHPNLIQRALANPSRETLTRDVLMSLQRTHGNQFVQRLMKHAGLLPDKPKLPIQAKLTVTPAGDQYEHEADAMAKHVVNQIKTPPTLAVNPPIQRQDEDNELQRQPEDDEPLQMMRVQRQTDPLGGMDVDSDIESSIQRARGKGQPIPANTRGQMEQAFGADFSGVRVHTGSESDTLNRSVQARAFTTGQDIFFRQGEYSPNNGGGQELLAHELTHVVQQTGDIVQSQQNAQNKAVIQRKVGFEFETPIEVRANDNDSDPQKRTSLRYQERIFTAASNQWKIEADNNRMEFVTEPFTENQTGKEKLKETMLQIKHWLSKLPGVVDNARVYGAKVADVAPALGKTSYTFTPLPHNIVINHTSFDWGEIMSAPQATGGFRLDQIPTLIDKLTNRKIKAAEPKKLGTVSKDLANMNDSELTNARHLGMKHSLNKYASMTGIKPKSFPKTMLGMNIDHAIYLNEAKEKAVLAVDHYITTLHTVPSHKYKNLKGLMTLVISYLLVGFHETEVMDYAKAIAPLMARTNFYRMFRMMEPDEQKMFTEKFVLDAAQLRGNGQTRVFVTGFNHDGIIQHGPTRSEWIDSIINGSKWFLTRTKSDLLSQGSGSIAATNSQSMGAFSQPDASQDGTQNLAVLELRRLPQEIHVSEWEDMAENVFDLIINLDENDKSGASE